jgi:ABC-type antimicrobial peptide transport system permease subunit
MNKILIMNDQYNIMDKIRLLINSFRKEKGFGILNILGLSVGMTMSLLIIWYLQYQTSFESHLNGEGRIYRLISKDKNNGQLSFGNPLPLTQAIQSDYPGIANVAALSSLRLYTITAGESKFSINGSTVTRNIFELLNTSLLAGSDKNALAQPGSSVLSQKCAQKLFGQSNPIGQTIKVETLGGERLLTIQGIMKNPPGNSEFQAEMYLNWETMNPPGWEKNWWWTGTHILVKLLNDGQRKDFEQKINTILSRHEAPFIKGRFEFQLIPLKASHFRPDIENPLTAPVSLQLLKILSIVAIFIIIIACINFVNLALGQTQKNTKEVGIYKVLGASRTKLAINFLIVTFQKVILAAVIALVLVLVLTKEFTELTLINSSNPFSEPALWIVLLGVVIVSTLLSGLYPALIISRPNPMELISDRKRNNPGLNIFRKVLVVGQISIATILITAVLFIFKQLTFLKEHDLGFNKEGLVALDVSSLNNNLSILRRKAAALQQEISKEAVQNGIENIGAMETIPGVYAKNNFTIYNPDNLDVYTAVSVGIDENFSNVLKIPITEGRIFSKDVASDNEKIMINETLKRKLGWRSIENKQIAVFRKENKLDVIGVFKDININSLAQNVPPMIYWYKDYSYPQYMAFRIKSGQEKKAIALIKSEWGKISEGSPFNSFSVADRFNSMYENEERLSKIIGAFCLVAVILSCFGLLAHMALSVSHRTKEIGIRKVNGARIIEILTMLNKDFVQWVSIAFLISAPITYYIMHKWLENFAYKTELSWWIFALAGLVALAVALLTVSWQSWKAATRNPVEALRYE